MDEKGSGNPIRYRIKQGIENTNNTAIVTVRFFISLFKVFCSTAKMDIKTNTLKAKLTYPFKFLELTIAI